MSKIKISGDGSVMNTTVALEVDGVRMVLPCIRFGLSRDGDEVLADIVLRVTTMPLGSVFPGLDVSEYAGPNVLDVGTTHCDWRPLTREELARVMAGLRGEVT